MAEYLTLIIIVGLPVVLGFLMRVSAPHLFFSVMAGELLARYFGHEAESALHTMFNSDAVTEYAELLILTVPVILTSVVLKNTVSRTKGILNIFPLVVTGLVFAAFAIPLLPDSLQAQVNATFVGREFSNSSSALIGFVVLFQLLFLWILNRGEKAGSRRKRKK